MTISISPIRTLFFHGVLALTGALALMDRLASPLGATQTEIRQASPGWGLSRLLLVVVVFLGVVKLGQISRQRKLDTKEI